MMPSYQFINFHSSRPSLYFNGISIPGKMVLIHLTPISDGQLPKRTQQKRGVQGSTLTVVRLGIPSSFCCRTTWTYVYGCPLVKLRKLIDLILLDRTFINDWVKQKLRSISIKMISFFTNSMYCISFGDLNIMHQIFLLIGIFTVYICMYVILVSMCVCAYVCVCVYCCIKMYVCMCVFIVGQ